jgi:hypothetical protein
VEGSEHVWPGEKTEASLPGFDIFNRQSHFIEIFNKGKTPFKFKVTTSESWIAASDTTGIVDKEVRIWVSIDWDNVPEGKSKGTVRVEAPDSTLCINLTAFNPRDITPSTLKGFVEANGYVSMEAEHYTKKTDMGNNAWIQVEDFGHTLSGMRATAETDSPAFTPGKNSPCLEFRMYMFTTGPVEVNPIVAPTLNFLPGRAIRYGISFDNEVPQMITLVPVNYDARNGNMEWEKSVSDNFRVGKSNHTLTHPGYHTLKIWMVDPGVVLQKIVVNAGGVKPSYLGPSESFRGN